MTWIRGPSLCFAKDTFVFKWFQRFGEDLKSSLISSDGCSPYFSKITRVFFITTNLLIKKFIKLIQKCLPNLASISSCSTEIWLKSRIIFINEIVSFSSPVIESISGSVRSKKLPIFFRLIVSFSKTRFSSRDHLILTLTWLIRKFVKIQIHFPPNVITTFKTKTFLFESN